MILQSGLRFYLEFKGHLQTVPEKPSPFANLVGQNAAFFKFAHITTSDPAQKRRYSHSDHFITLRQTKPPKHRPPSRTAHPPAFEIFTQNEKKVPHLAGLIRNWDLLREQSLYMGHYPP